MIFFLHQGINGDDPWTDGIMGTTYLLASLYFLILYPKLPCVKNSIYKKFVTFQVILLLCLNILKNSVLVHLTNMRQALQKYSGNMRHGFLPSDLKLCLLFVWDHNHKFLNFGRINSFVILSLHRAPC